MTKFADLAQVDRERATAIQDIHLLVDAAHTLRTQLERCEATYARTIERLESNTPVSEILKSVEACDARIALNAGLVELENARHRSRLSIIAAEMAEGTSISDVGRDWGFSRQMAQRYVKEARTGSWTSSHEGV